MADVFLNKSCRMSDLWNKIKLGHVLRNELIIDCHTHLGPYFNFPIPKPWAEGMLEAMDSCGICSVVSSAHLGVLSDFRRGNQMVDDVVQKYPDRFAGYCAVNPNYPEREILDELERYLKHGNFRGIKIHPGLHCCPANSKQYSPVWSFAEESGVVVLVHTWDGIATCDPLMFGPIAAEFPKANILLGHSGGVATGIDKAIQIVKEHTNVYLDLACSRFYHGILELMVKEVGAERILFGTDMPFLDCRPRIGAVAIARISDEDKRKIFGLNAKRLFRM